MSLILDALKRAERERHAERSAALADVPGAPPPRRRRWGRWLALGLVAIVAVGVTLSVKRRPQPAQQAAAPTVIPAPATRTTPPRPAPAAPRRGTQTMPEPAPAQPAGPAPSIQARPAPPAVIPGTEGVTSLDDLTPDSDLELVPAPAEAPPVSKPAPPAAPQSSEPERPEAETPAAAAPARDAGSPAPAVPPALTQRAPRRKLREMPPDYRADFPALTVEVHVFEPGRRFVMINGRRYREGERLAEGPQLIEIVRDGVVLDYRGEKVLYPIGR